MKKSKDFKETIIGEGNLYPSKQSSEISKAIRSREESKKKLSKRTLNDVVSEAISGKTKLR